VSGPYETEAEALVAAPPLPDDPHDWPAFNQRQILDACAAAGVYLGAYDHRIIEWLTGWEPATCAVIAGLITRAHAAGQDTGGPGIAQPGGGWISGPST
jgi:hypothetical protein